MNKQQKNSGTRSLNAKKKYSQRITHHFDNYTQSFVL